MKKALLIGTLLLVFFLVSGLASARVFFRFGLPPVFIGPPVVAASPPAYYPYPYGYYGPGYYGYRAWAPGYWENVWTDHGWEKVWHPGHWEYRP